MQVDMKTVIKSKTMYLSVMPAGSRPPDQLVRSLKSAAQTAPDSEVRLAHWVMVRERSLDRLRRRARQRSPHSLTALTPTTDSVDLDVSAGPLSPSRRLMLFFQVGYTRTSCIRRVLLLLTFLKVGASPYSTTERRVPELITVLGSQPAGDVSHKPGSGCHYSPPGLQLPAQPLRGLLPVSLLGEQRHDGCEQFA